MESHDGKSVLYIIYIASLRIIIIISRTTTSSCIIYTYIYYIVENRDDFESSLELRVPGEPFAANDVYSGYTYILHNNIIVIIYYIDNAVDYTMCVVF